MQKIIILDFGSQTTQLIARRIRELNTFCELLPYNKYPDDDSGVIGVILSGSPYSVYAPEAFRTDLARFIGRLPVLGICYGAQYIAYTGGGRVEQAGTREYGRQHLCNIDTTDPLLKGITDGSQIWMSHSDTITALPQGATTIASTADITNAAYCIKAYNGGHAGVWGVQFHPEVYHTTDGVRLLRNFIVDICGSRQDWSPNSFINTAINDIRTLVGEDKVVLGLSGGVDSSVTALLIHRAIGDRLTSIFVDHGMLRKNEFRDVMRDYECLGLNVIGVDASARFLSDLNGVTDPEMKRKIVGRDFVEVFNSEAKKLTGVKWLAQGTIYPDRIESLNITGKVIKSHHNVGGLPKNLGLGLCEPLKWLFKDEVRRVGRSLGMPEHIIMRHPFPGPGLAVRILGTITREKIESLQDADDIFIRRLKEYQIEVTPEDARRVYGERAAEVMKGGKRMASLYDLTWQAGVVLLSTIRSVGVMGDERTYEHPVALRAVTSTDAMTADWAQLPYDFLAAVSNEIINKVKGVNRVCYDISSKPPATIEWE